MRRSRVWVQRDLFGGPDVRIDARTGKEKAPATVTSSPGAVTNDHRRIASAETYRRDLLSRQAKR